MRKETTCQPGSIIKFGLIVFCIFFFAFIGYNHAQPVIDNYTNEKNDGKSERKETLIYENKFNKSQKAWDKEMREEWVLEGKGITESGKGYLSLRSELFTVPRNRHGHFNLWLKKDFPVNVAMNGNSAIRNPESRVWQLLSGRPKDETVRIYLIPICRNAGGKL
jgi:hypothetical protein